MAEGVDFSELMRRAVQANAKFYKGWLDLSFEYFRTISQGFVDMPATGAPVQEADAGAGALVLEGEAGTTVRGSFLVSNDMEKPVSCTFDGSDFRDPRGAAAVARTSFEPSSLQLAPGEQRVVQVAIDIDDSLAPGVGYAGEISIRGMEGFNVPIVLRRQHGLDGLARDGAATGDEGPPAADATKGARRATAAPPRGRKRAKKR